MQTGNLPQGVPKPNETLGYQIIRWAQKYIVTPDGDRAGEPWQFTPEQLRFVLWFYAITPDGGWAYSAATLRRAKGWGLARRHFLRLSQSWNSSALAVSPILMSLAFLLLSVCLCLLFRLGLLHWIRRNRQWT